MISGQDTERRVAQIHRVIAPDEGYPKEYTILVTDKRSIFIRQEKTRNSWVLRQEMRIGTALVTDVIPKTLEHYQGISLDALIADTRNLTILHDAVVSLEMKADALQHRRRDFFVRMVMKRQKEVFQVYNFEMKYRQGVKLETIKFYAVPLGSFFKPRRQTQTRETILRKYAIDVLDTFRKVLSAAVIWPVPGLKRQS